MSRATHTTPFGIDRATWLNCRSAAAAGNPSAAAAIAAIEAAMMAALPMALHQRGDHWHAEPLAHPPTIAPADAWKDEGLIRGRKLNPELEGANRYDARTVTLRAKRAAKKGAA